LANVAKLSIELGLNDGDQYDSFLAEDVEVEETSCNLMFMMATR
jgi:hypothetical protein